MMKSYLIVIPKNIKDEINNFCSYFAEGGENTFIFAKTNDGVNPTHYVCYWNMNKSEQFIFKQKYKEYMYDMSKTTKESVYKKLGLSDLPIDDEIS